MRMAQAAVLLLALGGPVRAADLWCMPQIECLGARCSATADTEASIRLREPESAAPVLRTHAEDVVMTQTHQGDVIQWQGQNSAGRVEILAVRRSTLDYVYKVAGDPGEASWVDRGRCEVQP
jgi:hypothetical protein